MTATGLAVSGDGRGAAEAPLLSVDNIEVVYNDVSLASSRCFRVLPSVARSLPAR